MKDLNRFAIVYNIYDGNETDIANRLQIKRDEIPHLRYQCEEKGIEIGGKYLAKNLSCDCFPSNKDRIKHLNNH